MSLSNILYFICTLTHRNICLNRRWSGKKCDLTSLWGQHEQQAYRAYACILPYDFPPYDQWHNIQRQRKTVTTCRRKTINKNQEYLYHIFNRVAIPKELVLPMFPSTSLNLEKEETQNSHFHWSLQADIWETNVVRIHTFCCLLSEVLRRFSCRILGVSSVQPGNFVPCGSPTVEEVKLSFYPSRCFWLVY